MFSCEYCEIFKNSFFIEHLRGLLLIFILLDFFLFLQDTRYAWTNALVELNVLVVSMGNQTTKYGNQ